MPKISVILSTCNDGDYIEAAVKSILTQTFSDFELLVCDDASTDRTPELLSKINDTRVILYRNETNRGLTASLNDALKRAKGEYIARMDGDDLSHPDRLEKQLAYMEAHPELMLIGCDTRDFGASSLIWRLNDDSEGLRIRMLLHPVLAHPTFFFRRELIDKGLSYDESFRTAQDYELASRVAEIAPIGRIPEILLDYRIHEKQVSARASGEQKSNADRVRENLLKKLGAELPDDLKAIYKKWAEEGKPSSVKEIKRANEIISLLEEANRRTGRYDEKKLSRTLRKLQYTWLIRARDAGFIAAFPSVCGYSPKNIGIFFGEATRTIIEKCRNRHYR